MNQLPAWSGHAARALRAAYLGDFKRAGDQVNEAAATYGDEVIPMMVLAWIDTTITRCGFDNDGQPVAIAWQREGTTAITDADSTPAPAVWAGRLFAARIADDEDQFMAIVNTVQDDQTWSQNVGAVLDTCAAMLRRDGNVSFR